MLNQSFLYLSKDDVHTIINKNYQLAIDAVRDSLFMMNRGTTIQPDKNSQILNEEYQNRINCMASTLLEENTCGVKWVSVFPSNKDKNLPNVEGIVLLSETLTGQLKCILNATETTSLRTAAIGALAALYLARTDSHTIGFIGAGEETKAHFRLIKYALPQIDTCFISSRTAPRIEQLITELYSEFPDVTFYNCENHYKNAIVNADIIVTAISSQEPVLKAAWIKKGALYIHVAGIEDEFAVAKKASKIICDNWECVKHRTQTIVQMYNSGELTESDIYGDLIDIMSGSKAGRESGDEFIYFNSVGLSVEDVLFNNRIYEQAIKQKIGTWIKK